MGRAPFSQRSKASLYGPVAERATSRRRLWTVQSREELCPNQSAQEEQQAKVLWVLEEVVMLLV